MLAREMLSSQSWLINASLEFSKLVEYLKKQNCTVRTIFAGRKAVYNGCQRKCHIFYNILVSVKNET